MDRILHGRPVESDADAAVVQLCGNPTTPHWYVVSTMARHEKQVAQQLAERRIEHFLPTYKTVHRWRDRRAEVILPLFPGYVFVKFPLLERLRVLTLPSVAKIVGFGAGPVPLHDEEMERLRTGLVQVQSSPHPYASLGQKVRIRSGPLAGQEGILERCNDNFKVVLSMHLIMQSVAVEVDISDLDLS